MITEHVLQSIISVPLDIIIQHQIRPKDTESCVMLSKFRIAQYSIAFAYGDMKESKSGATRLATLGGSVLTSKVSFLISHLE